MRRFIAIVIAVGVMAVAVSLADNYSVSIGTNTVKFLPGANVSVSRAWATNTAYANGTYVITSQNNKYMCLVSGTSGTNEISGGSTVSDGTNGLVWVRSPRIGRRGASVTVDGTNTAVYVFLSGDVDTLPSGMRLNIAGGNLTLTGNDVQGELRAATVSGSNTLVIATW